ncbi:hypothetical protein D3C80_1584280 [compost metagenome]
MGCDCAAGFRQAWSGLLSCRVSGILPPNRFWSTKLNAPPRMAPNLWMAGPKLRLRNSSSYSQLSSKALT